MSDSLLRKAVDAVKKALGISGIEYKFNEVTPTGKDTGKHLTKEDFVVAGLHYHKTAVHSLARANPEWRKISPTDDQVEYSPESQVTKIKELAKREGYLIPEEYFY